MSTTQLNTNSPGSTARTGAPIRKALRAIALLVVMSSALPPTAAMSHETDQYTLPVGREFGDVGPHLTQLVHAAVVHAVAETNAEIERTLRNGPAPRDGRATDALSPLQSADFIAGKVWGQLFATFPTNELLDSQLQSPRIQRPYPGLITNYRSEQSIYDDPLLMVDVTKFVRVFFRAATVSADGKLFGTDKIIHFVNLGRIYHSSYVAALKQGMSEQEAVAQAIYSASANPFFSENGFLGMTSTGIYSNADLAADYAGLKFYRNLTEQVRIGSRLMPSMLVPDGPFWKLNEQVRPDSDFFTAFITPHWNEALNPNVYAAISNARMRALLRDRCPDVVDWYRDEHGRRLSQRQFAELEGILSTFYGEDYGYRSAGKDTVSVSTTCFQPQAATGQAAAAGSSIRSAATAASAEANEHFDQGFGLQPGWGQDKASNVESYAVNTQDRFGRTRLWWAAKDGNIDEVERLLAAGADADAIDLDGEGPLHAAARWGRVDVIDRLLAHDANVRLRSAYGMTPLRLAVLEAQPGAARALLQRGADLDARDMFGKCALHDAVQRGSREMVTLLLDYGADPNATDDAGTTPLQVARHLGNEAIQQTLTSRTPNPLAQFPGRQPGLSGASYATPR